MPYHIRSGRRETIARTCATHALMGFALAACVSCGGVGSLGDVSGTVTVDGTPVEAGTISMRPVAPGAGGPAGGAIEDGKFQVASRGKLLAGKYTVQVQASKKTGRTIRDPQRGDVEEFAPLVLADSPQEIELSAGNAQELQLKFTTGKR